MVQINFQQIEKKWQKLWKKEKIFEVSEKSKKPKYYVLEQFPYPSGSGLHVGHAFIYTIGDIYARYKRMNGFNVLYPMGYDSLGLPAENAAIKVGIHPEKYTNDSIKYFSKQQKALGLSYDWNRVFSTHEPSYYKWDQWIFLKMFEKDLVYQRKSPVNWCPKCNSVLANEQVHSGNCWIHNTKVKLKHLNQWYFKITKYAEELADFDSVKEWPDLIKKLQKNWIGKSYGTEIDFVIESRKDIQVENVEHFRKNININSKLKIKDKDLSIKQIVKFRFDDGTYYMKLFLEDGYVLADDLGGNSFILVKEIKTNLDIKKDDINFEGKKFNFIYNSHAIAEETYGEEIFLKGNSESFWDYSSKDKSYLSLGIVDKTKERMDFFGKIIYSDDIQIINSEDKSNYLLLHGYTGSPEANFFPWLKKELESRNYKVSVPKLPNTNNPDVTEQIEYVLKNFDFDKNTVLLGHSLGAPVALKVIEKLKKPIKKLVLVAGFIKPVFKDHSRPYEKTFDWKFDFEKIKKNVEEIVILQASNDYAIRDEEAGNIQSVIGGTIINFKAEEEHICGKVEPVVLRNCLNVWPIFTTRPDTIYGVTFMVISAQHPRLMEIVISSQKKEVEEFVKKLSSVSAEDIEQLEKEGVFTGSYATNPVNNEKIPVYAGNFVLADYGSGMIMAVPAHDQRDFEFAKKYNLPIKTVIKPLDNDNFTIILHELTGAFIGEGILFNSGKFNGLKNRDAIDEITKFLEKKKLGRRTVQYKLKDWLISRQRYWGTPIPIVHCEKCGIVPVLEKNLPVILPKKVKFGKGNPLETSEKWKTTKCPRCNQKAKRETDTMDTFVNSSWYYLRYCDSKNDKNIFEPKKVNYWIPIDIYIGGKEHACMHDIYIRFYTKFLRDLGLIKISEPANKLFVQGMVHGEDGNKMSKSLGNVIDPMSIIEKYGADSLRLFLVSTASPDSDFNWSGKGIQTSHKFISKFFNNVKKLKIGNSSKRLESKLNKTIKEVSEEIMNFKYNLAVIKLRSLLDVFIEEREVSKKDIENYLKLVSVFCPHMTEELWEKIGNKKFISNEKWPEYDESKIDEKFEKQEQIINNTISDITNILKIIREKQGREAGKIYLYVMPNEKDFYNTEALKKKIGKEIKVFSVNDKEKYDPENKSKKAKPSKPGIFVE